MKKERGQGGSGSHQPFERSVYTLMDIAKSGGNSAATFNVMNYGAKGDGRADDTQVNITSLQAFLLT